jgi:hypothetical protein
MNHAERGCSRRYVLAVVAAALTALTGMAAGCAANGDRQAAVAERGEAVMPFDLDRTTHRFTKTDTGGVQTVVADDPTDTGQITPIQEHLRREAERFGRGDFSDPTRIHGADMPGLTALRDGFDKIIISYQPTSDGARISYTTNDPELVTALHLWFDAQVGDHGRHAEHG